VELDVFFTPMNKAQSSNVSKQNARQRKRTPKRSAGCDQVLREWRRASCDDQEKLAQFKPNQTSDLVNKALKTLRLDQHHLALMFEKNM